MGILFKNTHVVNADGVVVCDVLCEGEKIANVGKNIQPQGHSAIDCTGLFLLPAGIDAHTHMQMRVGEFMTADDYANGTAAAAAGGVTTIIDYCMAQPDLTLTQTLHERRQLCAHGASVDFAFHGTVSDISADTYDDMQNAKLFGVSAFKAYMVYDFALDEQNLFEFFKMCAQLDVTANVHAEHPKLLRRYLADGRLTSQGVYAHYLTRDEEVEVAAVQQILPLAKKAGCRLYVVHVAAKQSLTAISKVKQSGQDVFAETCPQYLFFDKSVYKKSDGYKYICAPSIKGASSQEHLRRALVSDDIYAVATDHCPFKLKDKQIYSGDFRRVPGGVGGTGQMMPLLLSLAAQGELSYSTVVKLTSKQPADLFGVVGKGQIVEGFFADLLLFDPSGQKVLSDDIVGGGDYSIYSGLTVYGSIKQVYCRGSLVGHDGECVATAGQGRFVPLRT